MVIPVPIPVRFAVARPPALIAGESPVSSGEIGGPGTKDDGSVGGGRLLRRHSMR